MHGVIATSRSPSPRPRPRRAQLAAGLRASRPWLLRALQGLLGAFIVLLATGCRHHVQQAYQPAPPSYSAHRSTESGRTRSGTARNISPLPPRSLPNEAVGKPTFVETGMASWYGTGKRAADGSAFDKNALTAAHKTLPMGTTVRVTNLANNESVTVRITDRGPFVNGRVLDLSEGAAKQIDLYRMGVAKVKIEAYAHPSAPTVGKWVVQTGAFQSEREAIDLKTALIKRYAGARVIEFPSSTGYWVRIDPPHYDQTQAEAILHWIGKPGPAAQPYLVRIN
jgi:rare lipoprotein A